MKRADDFKRAIGPADPAFESRIHRTLAELSHKEEERPVKRFSVSLGLVLAIVLLAAVALAAANQWGVMDFLDNRFGVEVLPEATGLIQQDVPQEGGKADLATFTLREAVLDGRDIFMVVAIAPADGETLLLGVDAMPGDPTGFMGQRFADMNMTIADYAAQQGKTKLVHTNIGEDTDALGMEGIINSLDFVLEEDGTLVYILTGGLTTDEDTVPVTLRCITIPFTADGANYDMDARQEVSLSFTLQSADVKAEVSSVEPAVYADCGVRVDRVTLSSSAMSTHVRLEYTVIDEAAYALTDDGLWFEFLDGNGERIATGANGSGSIGPIDENEENPTRFVQIDSLTAMESLPEKVIVRGYNAWEKNRYETHAFEMK